ncbi:RagB/SusD family nutrient uptake outer membrane protein [Chondrinema litorale]|uniref:RagB/SusD family nutrient uptake outer membrane protein n=1 Tax=Chondrinema litorale TaxID=2994555 RepID=UPI002543B730|nr:RagB/SusD family nutrient uptake outer membrane protein [Chondrinema litorale]UZR99916.1 RagB/SusD family nutrient uptake outer membrane protein [Chondrinema litorale]
MKRYINIILSMAIVAFFSQSCESFLEEELVTDVSAGSYYPTPDGFEDAVRACYTPTKNFWGQEIGGTMTVFGTDIFTNGADGSHKGFNQYDTRLNPATQYARDLWRDFYQAINQTNAVIGRAPDIDLLEADKTLRVAEARFLRALYYFTLTKHYGDIHFSLDETQGLELEANRTSRETIYADGIIPDLEFAIANLPETQSDYGRATKPAAEFLLAKVYLTRAYLTYNDSDFQSAYNLMNGVIENYSFSLIEDWGSLWGIDSQVNSEVIWTVQNTDNWLINGNGNRFHLYFLMEYDKLQGMQRDTENGRPWKRFKPTDFMLGLWNRDIDVRYAEGFKHVWYANFEGSIPTDGSGNLLYNIGDTSVFLPGVEWTQAEKDAVPYEVFSPSDYDERVFASVNKFIDPTRPDRQWEAGQRDFIVMRLADAYLIAAEALHQLGMDDEAVDYLNAVRVRAAYPGSEDAMKITASDVDLDFILDERARELFGEMHRWEDLTRTGKLLERVSLYNPVAAANIQSFHVLRPIPQDQIDRTPAGYEQNSGY